ncbi:hypothetical protein DCC39_11340 [Pueribacillus theae]|uniref:Uncharacterized protein n=1 Tax=Pueribacillus theae TaxID=2171751 RepID=A0A2U1JYW1_9BACI|nr:CLC_0170 family protein [Pueribacillus theae]PWA10417.1 hypothetical protein DCC39_11340 [Pueribacillus theae]
MTDIDYAYYIVVLLIGSGIFVLFIDVNTYKKAKMKKEKKYAQILGWANIVVGTVFCVSWWVYQRWLW